MGDGKARAFRQLLHGLNSQVGTDRPVSAQDDSHNSHQSYAVVQQSGKSEHDQPVSGSGLLDLYVTGREQNTALGDLVETDQKDVNDESDQQQGHSL